MKIDLHTYVRELETWARVLDPFVAYESKSRLRSIVDTLKNGRDNSRDPLCWTTSSIFTRPAAQYDGPGRSPLEVRLGWSFVTKFVEPTKVGNVTLWKVERMATHIDVQSSADGAELMQFHHDIKVPGQFGPHVHMQFSEDFVSRNGGVPLAVPRFPSHAMLPTDCIDLALSEFFPTEWSKHQKAEFQTLKSAQQKRLQEMAQALSRDCRDARMTPIARIQEATFDQNFKLA